MEAPVQEAETKSEPIRLLDHIRTACVQTPLIIAVDSETPAITRQQLQELDRKHQLGNTWLVNSASKMQELIQKFGPQVKKQKNKPVAFTLVLLAPSNWPDFNEIMEDVQEIFAGPIYLVDNSYAAATCANTHLEVKKCGTIKPEKVST